MAISILFWQLANQVTTISESKRLFPSITAFGQIGMLLAALYGIFAATYGIQKGLNFSVLIKNISIVIVLACFLLCMLFRSLAKEVGYDQINGLKIDNIDGKEVKSKKTIEIGFFKSLKQVFTSKYIFLIVCILFCYASSVAISEAFWKNQIKNYTKSYGSAGYYQYQSIVQAITAIVTYFFAVYCFNMFHKVRWVKIAIITPIVVLVTSVILFFPTYISTIVLVTSGSCLQIFAKSSKYAIFDITKETCFIPLNENLKSVGKAAADSLVVDLVNHLVQELKLC